MRLRVEARERLGGGDEEGFIPTFGIVCFGAALSKFSDKEAPTIYRNPARQAR